MPAGSSHKLPEDTDRCIPEAELSDGGDDQAPLELRRASSNPSSSSSSSKKNFPDCLEGRSVSWEDDGDMSGLRECFMAVSRGSGVSSRYFRVVDGSFAIVLPSGFTLIVRLLVIGRFFVLTRFIMTPSSESLSSSPSSIFKSSSSSSSPLASTAMHCSTCSLKWMCFRSALGDVMPEDSVDGATLLLPPLSLLAENEPA